MILQRRMLRACRSAAHRLKMADSLGTRLTGRELLIRVLAARSVLERVLAPDERAALLQWCQEVAAADGAVAAAEAELLQRFAEVLRTPRPVQSLAERE